MPKLRLIGGRWDGVNVVLPKGGLLPAHIDLSTAVFTDDARVVEVGDRYELCEADDEEMQWARSLNEWIDIIPSDWPSSIEL